MKHYRCACSECGHSLEEHNKLGICQHLDDDGAGYMDDCPSCYDAKTLVCNYSGVPMQWTVDHWACPWEGSAPDGKLR